MSKLRVGVVGAGHLGRLHAKLLSQRDDVLLVGVADPSPEALLQVANECHVRTLDDCDKLLEEVDAAIIAAPTHFHHPIALEFLSRGLPVFVEKPLASSVREADELVAAACRRGTVLQVGHIERFNPALAAVRPQLGNPRFVEAERVGSFSGRSTDIGVVLDLMIHDIDVLLDLVSCHVRSVFAMGLSLLGRHEDVAHARLEFENGCIAHLSASRVHFGEPRRQMNVWTERAMAEINFAKGSAQLIVPSEAVLRGEVDVEAMSPAERQTLREHLHEDHLRVIQPAVEPRNALVDEHTEFLECVRTGRTPRVSGADGRDALVVAERVLAAIQSHRWSEHAQAPRVTPAPSTLRGPHWSHLHNAPPSRRAG